MADYKLSKTDGGPIDPTVAKTWMKKYKDKHKDGVHAYFFGSDIIRKIIDNPQAVGMRVYFSYGENDKLQMVLVGAKEDGDNIWPDEQAGKDAPGGPVGDQGVPCPPYCANN
jgi:hypothetical protein